VKKKLLWRPATTQDFPEIVRLCNEANQVDNPARVMSEDDVRKLTATSEMAANTQLALDDRGSIIAFATVLEPARTPLAFEVEAAGFVAPNWRGFGLGSALLEWQETRARELFTACENELEVPRWITTMGASTAHATVDLLTQNGFEKKRTWLEMVRDLSKPIPEAQLPANVRAVTPDGYSEETWAAYNDAFRDHWGSRADTWEEWTAREARDDYRPGLSVVALGKNSDDALEVGGLVITRVNSDQFAAHGGSFAYIHLMGVRRSWRGRGIASSLLLHALQAFSAAGLEMAELTVDADSLTGAVSVYKNLGFYEARRHATYAKELSLKTNE